MAYGLYGQQPIAMATNSAAQQSYGRNGTMYRRTVGGLYGGALPNPDNVPTPQQTVGYATGNQYAPMRQPGLGYAPTTQGGYDSQMQTQNPGGRFFGGALPAMNDQGQPGFYGPPAQAPAAGNYSMPQGRFIGGLRAYTDGSNLTRISEGDPEYAKMQAAQTMFDARRGGLLQRQQDYQARTTADMAGRRAGVAANAYNKSQARKTRLGIGDPTDMGLRMNPEIAALAGLQQGGLRGNAAGPADNMAGLTQYAGHVSALVQAGVLDQEQAKAMIGDHMKGLGLKIPTAKVPNTQEKIAKQLTPQQRSEFSQLKTPQEKEQWLNINGITDIGMRHSLLGVPDNNAPIGLGQWAMNGLGMLGQQFGLFRSPPPAGPTRVPVIGPDGRKRNTAPLRPLTGPPQSYGVSGSY